MLPNDRDKGEVMILITSEDGKQYEIVEDRPARYPKVYRELLIRPIEPKKWEVGGRRIGDELSLYVDVPGVTQAQAELIKDCIEGLMDYIFSDETSIHAYEKIQAQALKARKELGGGDK